MAKDDKDWAGKGFGRRNAESAPEPMPRVMPKPEPKPDPDEDDWIWE